MRRVFELLQTATLILFLTACTNEPEIEIIPREKPTPPNCQWQTPLNTEPITPMAWQPQDLPFKGDTLPELLQLSWTEALCYVQHQGPIEIFRRPSPQGFHAAKELQAIPAASERLLKSWGGLETQTGAGLMAMISFDFLTSDDGHQELWKAQILLSHQSRPWHLWHEYLHFLISEERTQFLAPTAQALEKAQDNFKKLLKEENSLDKKRQELTKLLDLYRDYDTRKNLEEIYIELQLLHHSQQMPLALVDTKDRQESLAVVQVFQKRSLTLHQELVQSLLKVPESQELEPELRAHVHEQLELQQAIQSQTQSVY